ncbi:MAG: hypothetical protein L7U83_02400 [Akkermansiaceae bacterium]|jgi:hypothetical protein|nr:hypothetical protein [Akkermansiaceae bacterium]HAE19681.1 hypothetical protein [Verrucomicrobiales bacterium]HAN83625.1 hypothetical protein [Verrucomicrobiales bacterium]HBF17245.1 hypothetical protein [Verrucomicrobiales bacterium]HBI33094.1 hypothetical protein [Verrucomicrobiales bacterium]|tara:strand:+ start:237 stop:596 length:360 start_codon:yes stop_codon:yes gene_type:complete
MDPGIYKSIHFVGLIILFVGIGSLISADPKKPASFRLPAMIHGIGLLLILVSGFGLQAKLKLGFPVWMISKVVILLALGGSIALIKRKVLPPVAIYLLVIFLGGIAAYLGFSNSIVLRP